MLLTNLTINVVIGLVAEMGEGLWKLLLELSVVWWENSYRSNKDKAKKNNY